MKCAYLVLIIAIGLRTLIADDEVTEPDSLVSTEPSIISEKDDNTLDAGKSSDHEPNELEARLPSDYNSIRSNIEDSKFSCRDHEPGYYADITNDCQIFHRCLEGQDRVFSFICPEQTIFSQRALVCVWNDTRNVDCAESEDYYEESNRAFSGNSTAESNIHENVKNSTEMEIDDVDGIESDETRRDDIMSEAIKLMDIPAGHDLEIVDEKSEMIEQNSIEEKVETVEVEADDSIEFQAELIPSSFLTNGLDASIASSDVDSHSASHPQKISIAVLDPIIELPQADPDQLQMSESSRNIRKRSGNHRNRFLFKADAL